MLKSGTLVFLNQKREDIPIKARRRPEALNSPRAVYRKRWEDDNTQNDNFLYNVPPGVQALYLSSKRDDFRAALQGKTGPFGYKPGVVLYHLILWEDKPVWVSSEDVELEVVK